MSSTGIFSTGKIILFEGNSFYSKVIKVGNRFHKNYDKITNFNPTHAGIVYDVQGDKVTIAEALDNGFVKKVYTLEQLTDMILEEKIKVGKSTIELKNVKETIDKYLGLDYGWLDIFHIGLYLVFGMKNFIFNTNAKKIICAEADARLLYDCSSKKINLEIEFNKKFDLTMPIDLLFTKFIKWLI